MFDVIVSHIEETSVFSAEEKYLYCLKNKVWAYFNISSLILKLIDIENFVIT